MRKGCIYSFAQLEDVGPSELLAFCIDAMLDI